jgi:hypothetical protein
MTDLELIEIVILSLLKQKALDKVMNLRFDRNTNLFKPRRFTY